ncbi:MAG: STAS domain-containing protein [Sphingomonadales bacterium]|nr:STAS domain-containing protein [Sphingomonadales bacterium]
MSDLQIRVSQMEGRVPVTVLHVSGDIDANSAHELDAKTSEILGGGALHILLDLSGSSYMSSAGFRSMHKIYMALQGGDDETSCLKLLKPSDEVKRLMKAMGFEAHMAAYDDLSEAVAAF